MFISVSQLQVTREVDQSRAQSFSSSLSAVSRRDKLWDNGIFVPEIVGHRL